MSKRIAIRLAAVLVLVAVLGALGDAPIVAEEGKKEEAVKVPAYIGSEACKKCHFTQHKSWRRPRSPSPSRSQA